MPISLVCLLIITRIITYYNSAINGLSYFFYQYSQTSVWKANVKKFSTDKFVNKYSFGKIQFFSFHSCFEKVLNFFDHLGLCWTKIFGQDQTSANNSTWYCYLKITQNSGNIRGRILGRFRVYDSTRVIFESLLKNHLLQFVLCVWSIS